MNILFFLSFSGSVARGGLMLAEFSRVPASFACTHSQDSWVLFWTRGRFPSEQRCWGAAIPLPHRQKESAAQKNELFSFASIEQQHWLCRAHIWVLRALRLGRFFPGGGGCSDRRVQPCVLLQQRMPSTASLCPSLVGSVVHGIPQADDHKVVSVLVFSRVEVAAGYPARLQ